MRKNNYLILFLAFAILASGFIAAQGLEPLREQRIKYGPSLYITNVYTLPEDLRPGSEATVYINIENVAPHPLRDVIIELDLPSQFAPTDVSKKKIRTLNGSEKTGINFSIMPLPSSKEGIYKVPLKISYIDEIGSSYAENNSIGLKIAAEPKIFTELVSSDIYEGNLLGKVSIRIANIGVSDIKFLVVELLPSQDYDIISSDKDYVGEINSDDYETVDFKLKINSVKKSVNLLMKLDYADANNKEYSENVEIPLKIISAKEAGAKQNNSQFVILVVIGILILYIVYRKIRKRIKKH